MAARSTEGGSMLHSPDDNVKSIERGRALESVIYNGYSEDSVESDK